MIGALGVPWSMYDTRTIVGFGSFVLNAPLSRSYPAKTVVRVFEIGADFPLPDPPPLFQSERSNNPSNVVPISSGSVVRLMSHPLGPPLISINQSLFSPLIQTRQQPQTPQSPNGNDNNNTIMRTPPPSLHSSAMTAGSGAPRMRPLALGLPPLVTLRQGPMIGVVDMGNGETVAAVASPAANPEDNRMHMLERRLLLLEEASRQGLVTEQKLGTQLDTGLEQGLDDTEQRPGQEVVTSTLLLSSTWSSNARPRMTMRLAPITASTVNPPPPGTSGALALLDDFASDGFNEHDDDVEIDNEEEKEDDEKIQGESEKRIVESSAEMVMLPSAVLLTDATITHENAVDGGDGYSDGNGDDGDSDDSSHGHHDNDHKGGEEDRFEALLDTVSDNEESASSVEEEEQGDDDENDKDVISLPLTIDICPVIKHCSINEQSTPTLTFPIRHSPLTLTTFS